MKLEGRFQFVCLFVCFLKCQRTILQKISLKLFGYFLAEAVWGTAYLQVQPPDNNLTGCLPFLICGPTQHPTVWRGKEAALSWHPIAHWLPRRTVSRLQLTRVWAHLGEFVDMLFFNEVYSEDIHTVIFKLIQTCRAHVCMFALNCGLLSKLYF